MSERDQILEWSASGHLKPVDVPRALAVAGVTPTSSDWRKFIDALLLWMGITLASAGVIFFFAHNWAALTRFEKFALAETAFVAALLAAWRLGPERTAGKAALAAAFILTGALLALVGQVYQTGADAFELFAIWALLMIPFVWVGRFGPLWLLWIGVLNTAVYCYFLALPWWGLEVSGRLWALFALNVLALVAWEWGISAGLAWLDRWGARVIAFLTGSCATIIGVICLVDPHQIGSWAILVYFAWFVGLFVFYRAKVFDVFVLAGGVLSGIIVATAFLGKHLLGKGIGEAGPMLVIGLVVIGLSAAGAWWIREQVHENQSVAIK